MIRPPSRRAAAAVLGAGGVLAAAVVPAATASAGGRPAARHVLLLSVDGLHESDLAWWVRHHPGSALARLAARGTTFTAAQTTFPSDSFPGMVAQVTGGTPGTTGVYYDDSWNKALLPAGTTSCAGVSPGAEVTYFEQLDKNPLSIDAGQGLAGLPSSILSMTGSPEQLIDPAQLPVDPKSCKPVLPSSYLRVNTIFEVARAHGLTTAWSDKHPAYQILNGPSGTGIQDLFTPEINSSADAAGDDWTTDNLLTQQYDSYKVQAVVNEIDGYDHARSTKPGIPAIFGMNFQTVSTAQKLPTSRYSATASGAGGYLADGVTPGPVLAGALAYVDAAVGRFEDELARTGHLGDTTVILSAKHGQSPQQPAALTRIDDGAIVDALNASWDAAGHTGPLVAFSVDDDLLLWWLKDRSPAAAAFAKKFLLSYNGNGTGSDGQARATGITGAAKAYTAAGVASVVAGDAATARLFGTSPSDSRLPDLVGIVQHGVVYTGKQGKIAEHGGDDPQDRNVALLVSGAGVRGGEVVSRQVQTTQIAPTILSLLGVNPAELQAVRAEHTRALPLR